MAGGLKAVEGFVQSISVGEGVFSRDLRFGQHIAAIADQARVEQPGDTPHQVSFIIVGDFGCREEGRLTAQHPQVRWPERTQGVHLDEVFQPGGADFGDLGALLIQPDLEDVVPAGGPIKLSVVGMDGGFLLKFVQVQHLNRHHRRKINGSHEASPLGETVVYFIIPNHSQTQCLAYYRFITNS